MIYIKIQLNLEGINMTAESKSMQVMHAINLAMEEEMIRDDSVFLIGEDLSFMV